MAGLFLFGGLLSALMVLVPVVLILALLVILALRHDDDADASRAPAIYASLIAFVGLLTLLLTATGLTSSLVELTASDSGSAIGIESDEGGWTSYAPDDVMPEEFGPSRSDDDDAAISSAVGFLIAGAAALALLLVHRSLFDRRRTAAGAARRVHRAYLLVLCFVTALIAVGAGALGVWTLYRAIFPGTAGADNRADELRTLVTLAVLFVGAAGLWRMHWGELDLDRPDDDAPPAFSAAAAP